MAQEVAGVFVCGTTGEGSSLSIPERLQVAQRWTSVAPRHVKVVVHVGHTSLEDAKALAAGAQRSGAFAIAAMPPSFIKPRTLSDLVEFCAHVAAAAPMLPFYYYHIPSMTGVTYSMREFLELAADRIPTLAGIKFTHNDLADYGRATDFEGGRYQVLYGLDEQLLSALVLGCTAMIGGTYTFAATLYRRMIEAFRQGDLDTARKQQAKSREMIAALQQIGVLRGLKASMRLVGVDAGPPRLPVTDLSPAENNFLRSKLEEAGVIADAAPLLK